MMLRSFRFAVALVVLAAVAPSTQAADIVAGSTNMPGRAIQDITLLANTPFNPGSTDIFLPNFFGDGTLTINREAESGGTIQINSLSGADYYGFYPGIGSYVFGNVSPLSGASFSGSITNVVQDPGDPGYGTGQPSSFISGDITLEGASFGLEFLSGPLMGIKLFTDPAVPFSFSAHFDGLPPSNGTTLVNSPGAADVLNIYLYNPLDPSDHSQVVATSSNRIIVLSVPEPSSVVMVGLGACGLMGAMIRRSRRLN